MFLQPSSSHVFLLREPRVGDKVGDIVVGFRVGCNVLGENEGDREGDADAIVGVWVGNRVDTFGVGTSDSMDFVGGWVGRVGD